MAVKIIYTDVSPGSAEAVTITATGDSGDAPSLLPFGVEIPKRLNLERNRWLLDGSWGFDDTIPPFCTTHASDEDAEFDPVPTITFDLGEHYATTGFTVEFPDIVGEWAGEIEFVFYKDGGVVKTVTGHPDGSLFSIEETLTTDKVVLRILKSWLPMRRVRISKLSLGVVRIFRENALRKVSTQQLTDPSGLSVEADTCDWTLDTAQETSFIFQSRQHIDLYDGETLAGAYFIESGKRKATTIYDVETCDIKGIISGEDAGPFIWLTETSVSTILAAILGEETEFQLHSSFSGATLTGYLAKGTRLELLRHVLLALGAVVVTADRVLRIVPVSSGTAAIIPISRIDPGASVETNSEVVTSVKVWSHSYTRNDAGEIEVDGVRYKDTTAVTERTNRDATSRDRIKVEEIKDETMLSPTNVGAAARRLLAYYRKRKTFTGVIALNGEKPGDYVSVQTDWGERITGHIIRMTETYSSANKAEIEVLGVSETDTGGDGA